jgi:hypothetical protein
LIFSPDFQALQAFFRLPRINARLRRVDAEALQGHCHLTFNSIGQKINRR